MGGGRGQVRRHFCAEARGEESNIRKDGLRGRGGRQEGARVPAADEPVWLPGKAQVQGVGQTAQVEPLLVGVGACLCVILVCTTCVQGSRLAFLGGQESSQWVPY